MTGERFCIECGKELEPGARFCPACGAEVPDEGPAPQMQQTYTNEYRRAHNETLRRIEVLCVIWGILALVIGIIFVVFAESITDSLIDEMKDIAYDDARTYWDWMQDNGFDRDSLLTSYAFTGGMLAASGLMALVSAHFTHRRQEYTLALVALILSTVTACVGLITFLVGVYLTYKLSKCKSEFVS